MHEDVFQIIKTAIGNEDLKESDIPDGATFDLRRDIEYFTDDYHKCDPNFAAPTDGGWERSGDGEPVESEWGDGELVIAYRWDIFDVTLGELAGLMGDNFMYPEDAEPLGGYLDFDGMHPAVQFISDGMDWNLGGWTPVRSAADYIIIR